MRTPVDIFTEVPEGEEWYELILDKDGRLLSREWIYNKEAGEGAYFVFDVTKDACNHLKKYVKIEDGAKVDHLFKIVHAQAITMNTIFRDCWIKDYTQLWKEVKKTYTEPEHKYDPDGIEFIELYWTSEMSDDYLEEWGACCHGIGWELKEDKWEKYDDDTPSYKQGYRIPWGIDFCTLNDLLHLPLRLNEKYVIMKDMKDYDSNDNNQLFEAKKKFRLKDVIEGVFWEISFYGSEDDKQAQKKELDNTLNELDLDNKSIEELTAEGKLVELDLDKIGSLVK